MPRKKRSDSTAEAVRYATAADVTPPSNVPLTDQDMPFFASVIDEFPRADWTAHQLELAAMMAVKMRQLRDEMSRLDEEGMVLETASGNPCQNPRIGAVRMLDTSIMATRRSLQLHARARGEARDKGKRVGDGIAAQGGPNEDDLLARPN